jgi:aquaporin NIP
MTDKRKLLAEFIGTFAMVFGGCGAISVEAFSPGSMGNGGIAAAFGLVVCVMIYATGHISGAHFNPAVTLGFASSGRFPWREVPGYAGVQCLAAIAAMLVLRLILPSHVAGLTQSSLPIAAGFAVEFIISFFLMFVIASVATDHRAVGQLAGVAIGATVALGALVCGPLTNASMNPARSLGPAVVLGDFSQLWLFILAPCLGAIAAAWTYRLIRCDEVSPSDAKGCC